MRKLNIKSIVKKSFNALGLDIKKTERKEKNNNIKQFENLEEAILFSQGGKPAAFLCPIELCTHYNALGLGPEDNHPFVETVKQLRVTPNLRYSQSNLSVFYNSWLPKNAAEAIANFNHAPRIFKTFPACGLFASPWSSLSRNEVIEDTIWWNNKDNKEHGAEYLELNKDGWALSGPVSREKGELEFNRLKNLHESISAKGYDTNLGYIGITPLKRGKELRLLIGGGGYHRAAVLSALDFSLLPTVFTRNSIVDVEDVDKWPNVKNKLWSSNEATAYVDHLFDFDSSQFLSNLGCCKSLT